MTKVSSQRMLAVAGIFALALAVSASLSVAQDDPNGLGYTAASETSEQAAPEWLDSDTPMYQADFGTNNQGITTMTWQAFMPRQSTTEYDASVNAGRWVTAGDDWLYAALDRGMVPNGAYIHQIIFIINDSDATSDVRGRLCWEATTSGTGVDPDFGCLLDITSIGTPGRSEISSTDVGQILYRQDVDTDGTVENVSYHLSVELPSLSTANIIHSVRIRWERRVSNAPSTATFADVPTGSGLFAFVEALVDSGVTAGCGGGNYCPDNPVTRGQMAVFLSAAMGLNWDWEQTEPNP